MHVCMAVDYDYCRSVATLPAIKGSDQQKELKSQVAEKTVTPCDHPTSAHEKLMRTQSSRKHLRKRKKRIWLCGKFKGRTLWIRTGLNAGHKHIMFPLCVRCVRIQSVHRRPFCKDYITSRAYMQLGCSSQVKVKREDVRTKKTSETENKSLKSLHENYLQELEVASGKETPLKEDAKSFKSLHDAFMKGLAAAGGSVPHRENQNEKQDSRIIDELFNSIEW